MRYYASSPATIVLTNRLKANRERVMRTLLIDLDRVLNTYTGNYDPNFIPPIRDGAKEFLADLIENNYEIKIFTTRDKLLTQKWLEENNITPFVTAVTNIKEPAFLMIDDRCLTFDGNYKNISSQIKNFLPWFNF